MLALCAQICIWVSVYVEKAPNAPYFGPFSNRAKLGYVWGFISRYAHPNWHLSTQGLHSSLLTFDWHPTSLCLDAMKISFLNGGVKFSIENPPSWRSKILWNFFIFHFLYMKGNQIRLSSTFWLYHLVSPLPIGQEQDHYVTFACAWPIPPLLRRCNLIGHKIVHSVLFLRPYTTSFKVKYSHNQSCTFKGPL